MRYRTERGCVDILILAMAAGLLAIFSYNYQLQKEKKEVQQSAIQK